MPIDLHPENDPRGWIGLQFERSANECPGIPAVHVEYATRGCFRVRHDQRTAFLARLDRWYAGLWWTRPNDSTESLSVLPPLRAAEARELGGDLRSWAWAFHERLVASSTPILHEGTWRIEAPRTSETSLGMYPIARRLEECLSSSSGYSRWSLNGSGDVFALRHPSAPDSARVKAWRKSARDGTLPPLLLFFVSGLDSWLLVDGHDRLQAALLEGATPTWLQLSTVRTQRWPEDPEGRARIEQSLARQITRAVSQKQIDGVNQRLIALYREPSMTTPKTRAWPIPGGRRAWRMEAQTLVADGAPAELLEVE